MPIVPGGVARASTNLTFDQAAILAKILPVGSVAARTIATNRLKADYAGLDDLFSLEVRAWYDGLFVIRYLFTRDLRPDEYKRLRNLVSMIVKTTLGHVHVHHLSPGPGYGSGRARRGRPGTLAQTLVEPVRLATNALWSADRTQPDDPMWIALSATPDDSPPLEPRPAIVQLRRNYIKVLETILAKHNEYRDQQRRYDNTLAAIVGSWMSSVAIGFSGFAIGAISYKILSLSNSIAISTEISFTLPQVVSLPMTIILLGTSLYLWLTVRPRIIIIIRNLRDGQGFFAHGDPLNHLIRDIQRRWLATRPQPSGLNSLEPYGDDFLSARNILQTLLDGEALKLQALEQALTLMVALAAILFTAVGFQPAANGSPNPIIYAPRSTS